ncbi:heparan-alpha-glucosaminide N-acetyltransferase domain-containing protein [Pseudoalteromonas carrageenovora]|uniref:DUF1624 domain-containing protein n=1 Tax=Pseudoalteromonas carrageenovora TaxID=227 RepID=UPI0021182CEB|nr:heparan-alpha-glucosaminide N-acetyltransferase domain-containing protein [Pseudoalteromonas carrageenovora]MCQ8888398.1 heparan-alpha-glucosaminide N-acetyltransferase domain-containing protein [Pseudoalteromonas carrageenovora]
MSITSATPRLHHIDLLRGIIIIFMVIDHGMYYCLNYSVTDPMTIPETDPLTFFTRFVSHFCAPLFVFLAGLSAAITEHKYASTKAFSLNLIVRGLVLILFEFTIVSWSWSFNPLFPMLYAQVIWAIGWGFVMLGLLRLVGLHAVFIAGLLLVFGHNMFDGVSFEPNTLANTLWSIAHQKNVLELPFDFKIRTTYPVAPIIGLMALAYCAGVYYKAKEYSTKAINHAALLGISCLALYAVLRGFNLYGDASIFTVHSNTVDTVMSLLNLTKYPLSLQFMLLTVGLGLIALKLLSHFKVDFSHGFLQVLGKTSMFSYLVHLYLLHAIAWLLIPFLGLNFSDMTYGETLVGLPPGYGMSYIATLTFIAVVIGLTTLLAKRYITWKRNNKRSLIAKYI